MIAPFFEDLQRRKNISLGLDSIYCILEKLGLPQNKVKSIHIAGTNGKGSVAYYLAESLKFSGYKTGLYTSPHLVNYNERIRINGENISDADFISLISKVKAVPDSEVLTEFEFLTVVAFLYFASQQCDVMVIETGLGGRLDATNVIIPELSIITPISLDHQDYLGDNLVSIAKEKAGIIKKQIPVISAYQVLEVKTVLEEVAHQKLSPFFISKNLTTDYVSMNKDLALQALDLLQSKFAKIDVRKCKTNLANLFWAGRAEVISQNPLIIIDGAHNPAGMEAIIGLLKKKYPQQKMQIMLGTLRRKNVTEMLAVIQQNNLEYSLVEWGEDIQTTFTDYQKILGDQKVNQISGIKNIFDFMKQNNKPETVFLLAGSLYFIGAVKKYLAPLSVTR